MIKKSKERSENRDECQFHCTCCNMRFKTVVGLNRHTGTQKRSKMTGKRSLYSTPTEKYAGKSDDEGDLVDNL